MAFKIDFRKIMLSRMSVEERENFLKYEHWEAEKKIEVSQMNKQMLLDAVSMCVSNMDDPRKWGPGNITYNGFFWHCLLPEILWRLEKKKETIWELP